MAYLKWTVDFKLDDVPILSVPHQMVVERKRDEVVLQVGKKTRRVKVNGEGKLVLLTVQVRNAKNDSVQLKIGKSKLALDKTVLFRSGISGISDRDQNRFAIVKTEPTELIFTNTSKNPVTIDIQSIWEVKTPKKKAASSRKKAPAAPKSAKKKAASSRKKAPAAPQPPNKEPQLISNLLTGVIL